MSGGQPIDALAGLRSGPSTHDGAGGTEALWHWANEKLRGWQLQKPMPSEDTTTRFSSKGLNIWIATENTENYEANPIKGC